MPETPVAIQVVLILCSLWNNAWLGKVLAYLFLNNEICNYILVLPCGSAKMKNCEELWVGD